MTLNFRHDFVLSAIAADFEGGDLSSVFEDRLFVQDRVFKLWIGGASWKLNGFSEVLAQS